jgi:hypothetical protein
MIIGLQLVAPAQHHRRRELAYPRGGLDAPLHALRALASSRADLGGELLELAVQLGRIRAEVGAVRRCVLSRVALGGGACVVTGESVAERREPVRAIEPRRQIGEASSRRHASRHPVEPSSPPPAPRRAGWPVRLPASPASFHLLVRRRARGASRDPLASSHPIAGMYTA